MDKHTTTYRKARLASRLKAADVAAQLGVSLNTLYAYERGDTLPDSLVVRRMAQIYNVSADELINTSIESRLDGAC